jgi:hypothetical protein
MNSIRPDVDHDTPVLPKATRVGALSFLWDGRARYRQCPLHVDARRRSNVSNAHIAVVLDP